MTAITAPPHGTFTAGIGPVGLGTKCGWCALTMASAKTATMRMARLRIREN
jgi:hypothetical protein